MPFMDGLEATELIRTYEQTHRPEPTPIIVRPALASTYVYHRIGAHWSATAKVVCKLVWTTISRVWIGIHDRSQSLCVGATS